MRSLQTLTERVQWARPDIAVDHAECPERQDSECPCAISLHGVRPCTVSGVVLAEVAVTHSPSLLVELEVSTRPD